MDNLDLGNLPAIIRRLVDELRENAMQGATNTEWLDQQAMCVSEEAGEFIGAYRRWRGFARRAGSPGDVEAEMADVIISTLCMITLWLDQKDAATGDADTLDELIARKLGKIFSRGWVNKNALDTGEGLRQDLGANKVPLPTYGRQDYANGFGLAPDGYDPDPDNPGFRRDGYRTSDVQATMEVLRANAADDVEASYAQQHLEWTDPAIKPGHNLD